MAPTRGMNVEAVEDLGRQLRSKSDEIDTLTNGVDSLVEQLREQWRGQDASEFKGRWESQHRPALQRLKQAIDGFGQSALDNATEQRLVSGH